MKARASHRNWLCNPSVYLCMAVLCLFGAHTTKVHAKSSGTTVSDSNEGRTENIEGGQSVTARTRPIKVKPKASRSRSQSVIASRVNQRQFISSPDITTAFNDVPGVRTLRVGGLGTPAKLLLRGGTPLQTQVVLEDIALRSGAGRPFDLEILPAITIRSIEVWRGRTPAMVDSTAIAGTLRLQPMVKHSAIRAQMSSFGGGLLEWVQPWSSERFRGGIALKWLNVRGDFPFSSNEGTPLDTSDDVQRRRTHNRIQRASALLRHSLSINKRWDAMVLALAGWRHQQLPGLAATPAEQAKVSAQRYDLITKATRKSTKHRLTLWGRGGLELIDVDDRLGELGATQQRRQWISSAEVGGRWSARVRQCTARLATSGRSVAVDNFDLLSDVSAPRATRWAAAGSMGADCKIGALRLSPTLRLQAVKTTRVEDVNWTADWRSFQSPLRALPTAEFGVSASPWRGLRLYGSTTWASRAPTMIELVGNDGTVRPAPRLDDERSLTASLGSRGRWRWGQATVDLHGEWFIGRRWDLIQLVRVAPSQAVHTNIGRASVMGAEVFTRLRPTHWLAMRAGWTLFHGRDISDDESYADNPLPLRPASQLSASAQLSTILRPSTLQVGLRLSWRWQAGNFTDRANLIEVKARSRADCTAWIGDQAWRVEVRVDNVANTAQFDAVGFPLPMRRWTLNLLVRPEVL